MSVDISFSIGEHIEGRDSNPRGREREVREFSELSNSERSEAERSKARKKPAKQAVSPSSRTIEKEMSDDISFSIGVHKNERDLSRKH